jgi:hypothetical protein
MSVTAMAAVFRWGPRSGWTLAQRAVLLAVADHADDQGRSYPGLERIAWKSGVARETALRALKELEADGWLTKEPRRDDHGRQQTTEYWLTERLFEAPAYPRDFSAKTQGDEKSPCEPQGDNDAPLQGDNDAVSQGDATSPKPSVRQPPEKQPPPPEESNLQLGEVPVEAGATGDDGGGGEELGEAEEEGEETTEPTALRPSASSLQPASLGPAARLTALGVASEDRIREIIGRNTVEAIHAACDAFEQALAEGSRLTPGKLVDALTGGAPIRTRKGAGSAVGPDSASRAPAGAEHVYRCEVCGQGWRLAVPPAARPTCRVDGCDGRYAAMTHVRAEHPPP